MNVFLYLLLSTLLGVWALVFVFASAVLHELVYVRGAAKWRGESIKGDQFGGLYEFRQRVFWAVMFRASGRLGATLVFAAFTGTLAWLVWTVTQHLGPAWHLLFLVQGVLSLVVVVEFKPKDVPFLLVMECLVVVSLLLVGLHMFGVGSITIPAWTWTFHADAVTIPLF